MASAHEKTRSFNYGFGGTAKKLVPVFLVVIRLQTDRKLRWENANILAVSLREFKGDGGSLARVPPCICPPEWLAWGKED